MRNYKASLIYFLIAFCFLIFVYPNKCRADAINPLITLFTPDTAIPSTILTVLIIIFEAFLLRKWIKTVSFRLNLWCSALLNLSSSAAGSIVVLIFFHNEPFWDMTGLFIPTMFFLSLVTETPLLKVLYRRDNIAWSQAAKISYIVNFISYLFVFIAEIVLVFTYLVYADLADKRTEKKWKDLSLLNGESGYVFTIEYITTEKFAKNVLKQYDVTTTKWETIDPGWERGISPLVWDIKGDLLVCNIETGDWENSSLSILSSSTYTPIAKIKGNFRDVRISPDLKKIAALEYIREVNATKDERGYFMLGSACQLKIFDSGSGALLQEAPRMSLNEGLCWVNDSSSLVFASLRDETLFKHLSEDLPSTGYGRGYAQEGQFPIDLFVFDLATNSVRNLIEGQDPVFLSTTREISFLREKGMYKHDVWRVDVSSGNSKLILEDIRGHQHSVSPSGKKLLIQIPHKQPLGSYNFLTVIDPEHPDRKFIVDPSSSYTFRWISK